MLQKSTTEKTLEVFFNEPTKKHYLKEISQKIKVAHTSIIKILLNLQKEKIINRIEKKYGKRNFPFFVANINNDEFKILKKINNYFKEDINECSKELQNNILNGILLKGELEFK